MPIPGEDLGITQEGLSKCGVPAGTSGDADYCSNTCLCGQGEGDCDADSNCSGGLVCNSAKGLQFCFATNVDVCAPAHCRNKILDADETQVDCGNSCGTCCPAPVCTGANGDPNHCTTCSCTQGEGHCHSDAECQSGLVCNARKGAQYGLASNVNVCAPAHCRDGIRDGDETQPDCGGSCGTICPSDPCATLPPNGTAGHCTLSCPCPALEGGCGTNAGCNTGLVCKAASGAYVGMSQSLGVCIGSTCSNGTQDPGETGIDCGGSCLPCEGALIKSAAFGGSGNDLTIGGSVFDSSGNLYIAGRTSSSTINFGSGNLSNHGVSDIFLAKFDGSGTNVWSKLIGGTGADGDAAVDLAVDYAGNVILVGNFYTTVNFGGGNVTVNGLSDAFVAKYNGSGVFQWVKHYGGTRGNRIRSVAVDPSNNILVAGAFQDSISFGGSTFTAVSANNGNLWDICFAKLTSAGAHVWSRALGSTSNDEGMAITVDGSNYVYVGGFYSGAIDFGNGTLTSAGGTDAFALRINQTTGATVWSKSWGALSSDRVNSVTSLKSNNQVVFGGTFGGSVDFGGGAVASHGGFDGFIASVNRTDGSLAWAKAIGGTAADQVLHVASRPSDSRLAVVGQYAGATDFGGGSRTNAGSNDAFLTLYTPAGAYLRDMTFGGSGNDHADVVGMTTGFTAFGGAFASPTITFGGPTFNNAGGTDAFYAKFAL